MTQRGGGTNGRTTGPTATVERAAPHDIQAEEALLGAALLRPEALHVLATQISPEDFYSYRHKHVAAALTELYAAGEPGDPRLLMDRLGKNGLLEQIGGPESIIPLITSPPSSHNAPHYARIVKDHARRRRLIGIASEIIDQAYSGAGDPADKIAELHAAATITSGHAEPGPTLDTFLDADEPDYDWIVPGLLERGDRVIVTGNEGDGKSTLLRQLAVHLGAGIHPFTLNDTRPMRVMYVDLENSTRQVRRKLKPLRIAAGDHLDPGTVTIKVRPQGLDLLHADDIAWLDQIAAANTPDVVIIGPLYKMASGDPTDEQVAKAVSGALDNLRVKHQFAVIIEAHTPHSGAGTKSRPERPYGASLWLRWPEFGLYLAKEGNLRPWRGARDERDWPVLLTRGGDWPWTVDQDDNSITFARCLEELRNAGRRLSYRDLAKATGASRSKIERMIGNNRDQWDAMCASIEDEQRDLTDTGLFDDIPNPTADELAERRRRKHTE